MFKNRQSTFLLAMIFFGSAFIFITSCDKDDAPDTDREGIQRSELIFTEVTGGSSLYPHGDHFHGLGGAVEGESVVVKFDEDGRATENGHLHLESEAIYKIELKAWDYNGREVQQDFIASKEVADNYKAFLIGGNFALNVNSDAQEGAIFQPRELQYGDGSDIGGQLETTGVVSYFIIGHENEDGDKDVTFVLRRLNAGVKPTITRSDWNRQDYASAFAGENVLELTFEIHPEHGDHHDH